VCGLPRWRERLPSRRRRGAYGYAEFLEAVTNPEHEEHGRVLEWAGGPFDPTEFDLANANALLQKVR
jgi:hypothetical protein